MCIQMSEILIFDGENTTISDNPKIPESIIERSESTDSEYQISSTACYRGYIGTWEIREKKLYLNSVKGYWKLKGGSPVFADWFSGVLHIPGINEMYSGRSTSLKINKGVVVNHDF